MIELPFISSDLLRVGIQEGIQNFTIIATLVLLYSFVPYSIRSRSQLTNSLCVGIVFGLAAVISIPALWQITGSPVIGYNIILVPLAGFTGGPVSTVFVAAVLLLGSAASGGTLSSTDVLMVMSGILLGALFYSLRSWTRFPRSSFIQLVLLGTGVMLIELGSFDLPFILNVNRQLSGAPPLISIFPFLATIFGGTIILGSIIGFIDRKKLAEKELLDYKNHLEDLVQVRTAELQQANSLQKATIESTSDGIVVIDQKNIIRTYNQKASQILNILAYPSLDPPDAQVYVDHIIASLSDPEEFLRLVTPLPESAEQIVTSDLRFKSGRIYELYVQPQRIDDRIVGRVWSFHDITEQRLAEEALAGVNNKLLLLSNITRHDIFNQMTALLAYLELLEMANRDPDASAHLNAMKKSLEVIRLQLEFTRDYQEVGLKKPGWQNTQGAFTKAAEFFEGRPIAFRCETGPIEIFADPMLGQVFYNLMDNSLRHGERVSEIQLSLEKADPDLLLVYMDNGVGVPREEKEKIFLKGFGKHTGLGMFLIREILSITGITIHENGTYQQGVRFEIRVPSGKFRFL